MPESVTIAFLLGTPGAKAAQGGKAAPEPSSSKRKDEPLQTLPPESLVATPRDQAMSHVDSRHNAEPQAPKEITKPKSKTKRKPPPSPGRPPPKMKKRGTSNTKSPPLPGGLPAEMKKGGTHDKKSRSRQAQVPLSKKPVLGSIKVGSTKYAQKKAFNQKSKCKINSIKISDLHSNSGQPKKSTKRAKTAKITKKKASPTKHTKHQAANASHELGKGGSQERVPEGSSELDTFLSNATKKDSEIQKAVSGVMDMVADEIRHCATVFDAGPQESTLSNRGVLSCSKLTPLSSSSLPEEPTLEMHDLQAKGRCPNLARNNVQAVIFAIRRFVLEVYCPFLYSAKQNTRNGSPSADRIRISTLLAIREVLIMNAEKLFSFTHLNQPPPANSVGRDKTYLSHVFANAIIRNTARRIQSPSCFFDNFVQATRNYDTMFEDFQISLAQADVRSVYILSDGRNIGQEESTLAKVGFNYARVKHPLVSKSNIATKRDSNRAGQAEFATSSPVPTACAAFQIESDAACEKTDDETEILESLKKLFERQHD